VVRGGISVSRDFAPGWRRGVWLAEKFPAMAIAAIRNYAKEFNMQINHRNFSVGQRIEWFIGPRKLRREGVVRYIGNGFLEALAERKTHRVRRVLQSADPRPLKSHPEPEAP